MSSSLMSEYLPPGVTRSYPTEAFLPRYEQLKKKLGELRLPKTLKLEADVNLLTIAPVAVSSLAAVVLVTRVLVRKDWSEEAELSQALLDKLADLPPPVPRSDDVQRFWKRDHRYRARNERRVDCTTCTLVAGRTKCGVCEGLGMRQSVYGGDTPCGNCRGSGFIPCSVCGGVGHCFIVQMHYATDSPIEDRRIVMPSLVGDLDDQIARSIALISLFPEELRIDLQPTMIASAYRGATSIGKPDLFGFDYLDAWDRGRASLPRSPPNTILREDEAWGWPFLCIRYEIEGKNVDVGIVSNDQGKWSAVFATPA